MKEMNIKSKTNSDHQERIKKRFKNPKSPKSGVIFDFLNEYGSLSSDDLAALVGQNKRSHSYHYSLKELRDKGYAEEDPDYDGKGKKFRLTDNAFLKVEVDRIKNDDIDTEKLAKKVAEGTATIMSRIRKNKDRKSVKQELKVKDEESEANGEDDESNTSSNDNEDAVPDIVNSSELSDGEQKQKKRKSPKIKIEEAANKKETTSLKNNKRQRIKHD
jgi:hypothetical protein